MSHPHTQLSVVAHSLGNLAALWAFHYRPSFMAAPVFAYIAIGAPFQGTPAALNCSVAVPCQPYLWQLKSGSQFLQAVNSAPLPAPARYLSVVSVNDPGFGDQWRKYTAFPASTQGQQLGIQELCTSGEVADIAHVQQIAVNSIYLLAKDVMLDQLAKPVRLNLMRIWKRWGWNGPSRMATTLLIVAMRLKSAKSRRYEAKYASRPRSMSLASGA